MPIAALARPNNEDALVDGLKSQLWRLNNLYYIIDEDSKRILFRMNWAQLKLYKEMWYRNNILKARQIGFTTFIQILGLDVCLFTPRTQAAVIAHNKSSCEDIFNNKIKYAYDNLYDTLKRMVPLLRETTTKMDFANGSSFKVSTSTRSGTVQFLHVSELGKISKQFPNRSKEIITGSLEAVPKSGRIFLESTAEGRAGEHYRLTNDARNLKLSKAKLTRLDYKFFFFPWWRHPPYKLTKEETEDTVIYPKLRDYFKRLEKDLSIKLSPEQKAWYSKKKKTLGNAIKREHPSTPDEAFEATIRGAIFGEEIEAARNNGRITKIDHNSNYSVDTWWDIGFNGHTSIWFTQTIGRRVHAINFYENHHKFISHYAKKLKEFTEDLEYDYGIHMGPHDINQHDIGFEDGKTRRSLAAIKGIDFDFVPRVKYKIDSIEAAREIFPYIWFDMGNCSDGIEHLENYRNEWDEQRETYKKQPLADKHSHGSDAFQCLGMGHSFYKMNVSAREVEQTQPGGWT